MGLPQPLIDALRDIELTERLHPEETPREGTEASLQKMLSDFRGLVRDLEKSLERVETSEGAFLQKTEQEISAGSPSRELDETIDWLLEQEEELRRKSPVAKEQVQRLQARIFSSRISTADKALGLSASERFDKARLGVLKRLRDLRWNLMALRAEVEDPGDAPVFDNPQDLLDYLKTSSK